MLLVCSIKGTMAAVCTAVGRALNERYVESMGVITLVRRLKREDDRCVSDDLKNDWIVVDRTKKAKKFRLRPRATVEDHLPEWASKRVRHVCGLPNVLQAFGGRLDLEDAKLIQERLLKVSIAGVAQVNSTVCL